MSKYIAKLNAMGDKILPKGVKYPVYTDSIVTARKACIEYLQLAKVPTKGELYGAIFESTKMTSKSKPSYLIMDLGNDHQRQSKIDSKKAYYVQVDTSKGNDQPDEVNRDGTLKGKSKAKPFSTSGTFYVRGETKIVKDGTTIGEYTEIRRFDDLKDAGTYAAKMLRKHPRYGSAAHKGIYTSLKLKEGYTIYQESKGFYIIISPFSKEGEIMGMDFNVDGSFKGLRRRE